MHQEAFSWSCCIRIPGDSCAAGPGLFEAGAGFSPELLEDQLVVGSLVHRLDRNVGGVMVYARTRQAASALSRAVQAGNLQKEYLALIHGCPTQPAGTWEDLLWKDSAKNKVFVVHRCVKGVKENGARLPGAGGGHSSDPRHIPSDTGRSHQIRVQFASRFLPLAADHGHGGSRDG